MPIETAPHDNATWVLVWDGDQIDIAIFGRHPLDVQEEMALCWTDGGRELNPTHWMPLPDPPNPKAHVLRSNNVEPVVGDSELNKQGQ